MPCKGVAESLYSTFVLSTIREWGFPARHIKSFDWEAGELNSELADKMDEWLDSINVPSEDRPKQNEWKHTTLLRKEDNRDHLIMFFDEDTNQLYVVEYFL